MFNGRVGVATGGEGGKTVGISGLDTFLVMVFITGIGAMATGSKVSGYTHLFKSESQVSEPEHSIHLSPLSYGKYFGH